MNLFTFIVTVILIITLILTFQEVCKSITIKQDANTAALIFIIALSFMIGMIFQAVWFVM